MTVVTNTIRNGVDTEKLFPTPSLKKAKMTTRIRNSIGRAVVLGVAAIAMTVAFSTAPANASIGPGAAELTVSPFSSGYHNVAVFGQISMTEAEAQNLLNTGHKVVLRLWGDDPSSDDLLIGPYNATAYTSPTALQFHKVLLEVNDSTLDEDWEGRDELYVGARLVDSRGRTVRAFETNRVYGYF